MSAIAGILCCGGEAASPEDGSRLMEALRIYPADETGVWQEGPVFLGCRAQWITPESRHERLPLYDERDQLAIAADAIVDNREELFDRLRIERERRARMTDAELILAAYRRWEEEAPQYLIGDFAFAVWDRRKRRLFAARDLLGSRTLYYRRDGRRFAFCTAMRPLLALPGAAKELNESWLAEFLAIPIILDSVDVHSTVYRGIEQIPPAHSLTIEEGKLTLKQYGTLAEPERKLRLRSNGEYEEAFRDVFRQAVASKLRTFRQVGASLSGGLDSGAVIAFAAAPLRSAGKTLHAYSYVPPADFTDWTPKRMAADESPYIKSVASHIGNISENYLDFPERNPLGEVDDLLELMEAPYKFFENSFWIKGILERAAASEVGVLLTGARGNYSMSWGPAPDYYARLLRKLRWVRLYRELKRYGKRMGIGRSRLLRFIAKTAYPGLAGRFAGAAKQPVQPQLIDPDLARRTNVFEKLRNRDVGLAEFPFDEFAARADQFGNLAASNHQGTSITKFSLRYAIWERDPTSDPRVVRFCLSLPIEQYVQDGMDRSLIRRSTAGYLPDSIRFNQRVRGVQGADWIHRMIPCWRAFTNELQQLCRDPAVSHYVNVNQIKRSLSIIGPAPKPEQAYDPDARILMQGLIVGRFLRQFS
jgi:asparagine synthase (glutamine-hydrolysing)